MRKFLIAVILAAVFASTAVFGEEPNRLEKIVVTPSRIEMAPEENSRSVVVLDEEAFPYSSYDAIFDAIGSVGGIDIRRRGPEGVQSDNPTLLNGLEYLVSLQLLTAERKAQIMGQS